MSNVLELTAQLREKFGTGEARALRRNGMVPAIIYGNDKNPLAVAVSEKEITKHYRTPGFKSTIVQLEVGKKKHNVIPKAVELHPVTDIVRHVDFMYLGKTVQKVDVPINFEGRDRSVGIKRGGVFNIVRRYVTLSCHVDNIPKNLVLDVTDMRIGQSIKATDIKLPEGCKLLEKSNLIVASITGRGDKGDADKSVEAGSEAKAAAVPSPAAAGK